MSLQLVVRLTHWVENVSTEKLPIFLLFLVVGGGGEGGGL